MNLILATGEEVDDFLHGPAFFHAVSYADTVPFCVHREVPCQAEGVAGIEDVLDEKQDVAGVIKGEFGKHVKTLPIGQTGKVMFRIQPGDESDPSSGLGIHLTLQSVQKAP